MATVSMEEFGALQSQLMQMKAGKIALEDMNRRYMKEMEDSSKEVAKLQRIITKSKKAKEFQALIDAHAEEMQQLNAQKAGLTETLTNLSAENEALRIGKPAGPSQSDGHPLSLPPQVNRMEDDLTKSKKRCAELELKLTTMMKNYDEIKVRFLAAFLPLFRSLLTLIVVYFPALRLRSRPSRSPPPQALGKLRSTAVALIVLRT